MLWTETGTVHTASIAHIDNSASVAGVLYDESVDGLPCLELNVDINRITAILHNEMPPETRSAKRRVEDPEDAPSQSIGIEERNSPSKKMRSGGDKNVEQQNIKQGLLEELEDVMHEQSFSDWYMLKPFDEKLKLISTVVEETGLMYFTLFSLLSMTSLLFRIS